MLTFIGRSRGSQSRRGPRVVEVRPLSARREAMALAGVIALIVALMAVRFYLVRHKTEASRGLKSYQVKDLFLKNQAPIMYRSLCSVVGDILDLYQDEGSWPDVETLKDEGLPPFDTAFLPPGLKGYVWKMYKGEGWVDYFGVNSDLNKKKKEGVDPLQYSFILRIIDLENQSHPHPHVNVDSSKKRFVWQVWVYPAPRRYPGADQLVARGWKWVVNANDIANGAGTNVAEKP